MNIIVVFFRAFDKDCKEPFIDKTFEEINTSLNTICKTHIVTQIVSATNGKFEPLENLEKFKTKNP